MKTKKKVAPKRKPTFTGKATKQDLSDLAYWKRVVNVINLGRTPTDSTATYLVQGFTYRNRATIIRIYDEWDANKKEMITRSMGDSLEIPGYFADILLNLNQYCIACWDIKNIMNQFN